MRPAFSTTFAALLLALLACTACSEKSAPEGGGGAKAAGGGAWEGRTLWFEPLLARTEGKPKDIPHTSLFIQPIPGEDAFFMLGRNGGIHRFDRPIESLPVRSYAEATDALTYEGTIEKVVLPGTYADGDMGSIGFSLDPNYAENRWIYVWWVNKGDTTLFLDRMTWKGSPEEILASKVNVITFSRNEPPAPYHMGGIVQFLPDGTLVLSPGDAEQPFLAQDPTNLNGKLLRIRPNPSPEGGYTVPEDNPYVGDEGVRPEILAFGVRAPFRAHFHENRHLIFGDVGSLHEEINVWSVGDGPVNFGWGRAELNPEGISDGPKVVDGDRPPIMSWNKPQSLEYAAEDPEYTGETRLSAGVGLIYSGKNDRYQGRLTGKLVVMDIMQGWIRAGEWKGPNEPFVHEHVGHKQFLSHMIEGKDGYVYVTTWGGGTRLWRMRSPLDE